jgi:hypothetical protein
MKPHTMERLQVKGAVLRYFTMAGFGSTPTSSASLSLMDNAACISYIERGCTHKWLESIPRTANKFDIYSKQVQYVGIWMAKLGA